MRAILDALSLLDQSLEHLEGAAAHQQRKAATKTRQQPQNDLFSAAPAANGRAGGNVHAFPIDPAVLASKLDVTIERVEQILKEG